MPTYEYACTACSEHLEVSQSFSDPPLTTCPACGGSLRKVFGAVGIVLKGSGFYRTDSRTSANGKVPVSDPAKPSNAPGSSADSGSSPSTGEASKGDSSSKGTSNGGSPSGSGSASAGVPATTKKSAATS